MKASPVSLVTVLLLAAVSLASGTETVGAAQVDGVPPTISDVSPTDGTVTDDGRPLVLFTLTDDDSGFSVTTPGDNISLDINGCPVADGELSYLGITNKSLSVAFDLGPLTAVWALSPVGGCANRAASTTAAPSGFGIDPGGTEFTWSTPLQTRLETCRP